MNLTVWQADVLLVGAVLGTCISDDLADLWIDIALQDKSRPLEMTPGALAGMLAASRVTTRHIVAPRGDPPIGVFLHCYAGFVVFAQINPHRSGWPTCWTHLHAHPDAEMHVGIIDDDGSTMLCRPLRPDSLTGHYVVTDLYAADADMRRSHDAERN